MCRRPRSPRSAAHPVHVHTFRSCRGNVCAKCRERTGRRGKDEKERHSLFPRTGAFSLSFPLVGRSIKAVRTGRKYVRVIARPKVALAGIGRREREKEDKETLNPCGERTHGMKAAGIRQNHRTNWTEGGGRALPHSVRHSSAMSHTFAERGNPGGICTRHAAVAADDCDDCDGICANLR